MAVTALLWGLTATAPAQELDAALRERDMSQVLQLLRGASAEEPPPEPGEDAPSAPPVISAPVPVRPVQPAPTPPPEGVEPPQPVPTPTPHRVTVVSPDGSVREAQPAPTLVTTPLPAPQPVPAVSARPVRAGSPAHMGTRPALSSVPKITPPGSAPSAAAAPAPRPRPDSALPDVPAPVAEEAPVPPEEEARARAASLLSEVTVSTTPAQAESFIPSTDSPESAVELRPDVETEPDAPVQPLGLLDQLAERLGASLALQAEPGKPAETQVPDAGPKEGAPPRPIDSVASAMEQGVHQIRLELDRLIRASKADLGLVTEPGPASVGAEAAGWRFSGQWRGGKMDGVGTLSYPDGWRFSGDWREGRINGKGVLVLPDGSTYDGEWVDGRMDGLGSFTFPDGWRYVGHWRAGRMHGAGELIHPRAVTSSVP